MGNIGFTTRLVSIKMRPLFLTILYKVCLYYNIIRIIGILIKIYYMSELSYNSFKVGVSRHRRMSRLIKYSGADEKTIQAMTNKGNK